ISAPSLSVVSNGSVALTANNNVGTLAGSVTGPGFSFANVNDLTVGTVGISGLTVGTGDIFLTVSGPNKKLTIANPVIATSGSVSYTADHQAHTATTTTGGGSNWIEVKPDTPAAAVEFSSSVDVAGVLRLSSGALLGFSTPLLKVGNISNTAGIQVKESVTASSFSSMSLITGGAIGQDAGRTLTVSNLNVDGAMGVALLESNSVTNLAGSRGSIGGCSDLCLHRCQRHQHRFGGHHQWHSKRWGCRQCDLAHCRRCRNTERGRTGGGKRRGP
ncbi:MAG: hypothetical protein IPO43_12610, partial [Rhodoferax sp.]|nr:hypothetical protein [Rhodoferax sp.]